MDEAIVDLWSTGGASAPMGLWLYNAGWSRLSPANPDYEIAADIDADAVDEVISDFGGVGLWKRYRDTWTQMTGVSPEFMTSGNHDVYAGADLVVDFGSLGVWLWSNGAAGWFIQSGANKTVPVAILTELVTGDVYQWGALMAGSLLGSLPVALFYSLFVDYYVSSLTGAVKE